MIDEKRINARQIWVIAALPKRAEREALAKRFNADLIFVERSYDDCIAHANADTERKNKDLQYKIIRKWFDDYEK
jgi:hypothetical protein